MVAKRESTQSLVAIYAGVLDALSPVLPCTLSTFLPLTTIINVTSSTMKTNNSMEMMVNDVSI